MRPALDLDAIKARADAATPGPWHFVWTRKSLAHDFEISFRDETGRDIGGLYGSPDFIAHSREDVDALVAEVERLRAALQDFMPDQVEP